jgi:hypothetical protein
VKAKIVASELLLKAVHRHEIHLSLLVADTGLWANPDFHSRLVADTGSAADFYPADWRDPQPDILIRSTRSRSAGTGSDKISQEQHRTLSDRITYWSGRPDLNVHKIIALVASYRGGVSRDELVRRVEEVTGSKSPYGAVASLLTDSGNAYGRVFSNHAGIITIHQDVEDHLRSLTWRPTSAST